MHKKLLPILVIVALLFTAGLAVAEEVMLEVTIDSATEAIDKNGNPYVRFIVTENRTMKGITYPIGVPVMAFGSTVEEAQTLKAGDTLKAIASKREYQNRDSYTILTFLK